MFCCFSNHYKITEEMFAAWMAILGRVGNALWPIADNQWSCANLQLRAVAAGIDPGRGSFRRAGRSVGVYVEAGAGGFVSRHVALQCGTIASDAIRMGLPLLTLLGAPFAHGGAAA